MVALPSVTPVTTPLSSTVATEVLLDLKDTAPVLLVSTLIVLVLPADTERLSETVRFVMAPVWVKKELSQNDSWLVVM